MKKIFIFLFVLSVTLCFAQGTLNVYNKVKGQVNENSPVGTLVFGDKITELPIPKDTVERVKVVTEKRKVPVPGKKGATKTQIVKKRIVRKYVSKPKVPPKFVPIECKHGKVWVKRADLARFQQESLDLSGEYASSTGSVFLKKSPNNPKRFNVVIQNGPFGNRAEIEMGNLEIHESNGHARMTYHEDGCDVEVAIFNRQVKVVQRGCYDYNIGKFKLEGDYLTYKGNSHKADVFNMPEKSFTFKYYQWCDSGFDSCREEKDENGKVTITWSKGGNGFVERKAGGEVHTYRPFEHVIPHKRYFYKGEKPVAIKTKRTDMSGEWMIWYFYPKAERFIMSRAGLREDSAQMEIYE